MDSPNSKPKPKQELTSTPTPIEPIVTVSTDKGTSLLNIVSEWGGNGIILEEQAPKTQHVVTDNSTSMSSFLYKTSDSEDTSVVHSKPIEDDVVETRANQFAISRTTKLKLRNYKAEDDEDDDDEYDDSVIPERVVNHTRMRFPQPKTPLEQLEELLPPEDLIEHRLDTFDFNCKCRNTYHVTPYLQNSSIRKARFVQKVLLVKMIQALIINAWFGFSRYLLFSKEFHGYEYLYRLNESWIFLPMCFFFFFFYLVKHCSGSKTFMIIVNCLLINTFLLAYVTTAMYVTYERFRIIFEQVMYTMVFEYIFLIGDLCFNHKRIEIHERQILGDTAASTFLISATVYVTLEIGVRDRVINLSLAPYEFGPAFGASFCIAMLMMNEIKCVMAGKKFTLDEDDWLFVAMAI